MGGTAVFLTQNRNSWSRAKLGLASIVMPGSRDMDIHGTPNHNAWGRSLQFEDGLFKSQVHAELLQLMHVWVTWKGGFADFPFQETGNNAGAKFEASLKWQFTWIV